MFGPGHATAVLRGVDVDMPDAELIQRVPELQLPEVRQFAYPAAFYEHVRSNLSHEWKLSPSASSTPMTRLPSDVSYVNHGTRENPLQSCRLIHFHMDWLAKIADSIASNTAELIEDYRTLPAPSKWWLEGA
jgi:hypothetical protein